MALTNHKIEELIKLCISGNQFAQLEIYNRYYKAMYNTAFRIVKNSFEAEDVMQDSFLLAFTKLETLKEIKTFSAWLKKIVINNSIKHLKKTNKLDEVPLETVICKAEYDTNVISSDTETSNRKVKQIIEVLNTLKDNYRIALTLHLIEGYDYEEISEILNISYANCRTIISRAKESLRKKISLVISLRE